jgi:hypothetical protein
MRITAQRSGLAAPPSTHTELAQLRVRVVALENLVIALLAQAPEQQLRLVREMAVHISPRPGFTRHRLTLHAADEMRSLVDRARRFRAERLRVFRSCPLITPQDACSSLQILAMPRGIAVVCA